MQTDKKVGPARLATSPVGRAESVRSRQAGFTLLETVCILAIIALLAAIVLPALPRGTSKPRLESYALETAALLKADRNAALRLGKEVSTQVDVPLRTVRSGATNRRVRVPNDVTFEATLASRCSGRPSGGAVRHLPSGMSCGGAIALKRGGSGFEVRVNWLTGGVDVVSLQ
ncbi:MAG: ral secretion pathway protein [Variibacter sp.]|nr:ral secretion pathway protein [Variibacter sp.]